MWIFGAYGNSEEYLTDLAKIKSSNIGDSLKVQKVVLMDKTDSKTDDTKTWPDVVKGTAWISVKWVNIAWKNPTHTMGILQIMEKARKKWNFHAIIKNYKNYNKKVKPEQK